MKKLLSLFLCMFTLVIFMFNLANADPRARYQELSWTKSSYDYAPSILWDGSQWVMYHCGFYLPTNSDGIFRSTSSDGVNWTSPQIVLTVGSQGSWDDGHVCDPSVLKGVNIYGYSWAMYYTALHCAPGPSEPCTYNQIGLALSNNGITWTKYAGNPIIPCQDVPGSDFYGCGQQSVAKVGTTYYMTHTEVGNWPGDPFYGNRFRTSTNGINWTAGTRYYFPDPDRSELGPDAMYVNGKWYLVVTKPVNNGEQYILRVYTYSSDIWEKIAELWPNETKAGINFLNDAGFFRDSLGQQLSGSPDIWFAYGLAASTWYGDPTQEIEAGKLAVLDAEQNSVDSWLKFRGCNGSYLISGPAYAWNYDGPKGDDINYWDLIADGDGIDEFCDMHLTDFVNRNFSAGSRLEVTWYGWASGGTTANPKVEVWFQNGNNPPQYTLLGYLQGTANTKYVTTFTLPSSRSDAYAIIFRVWESYYTNLSQPSAVMRTHLFKVRLVN